MKVSLTGGRGMRFDIIENRDNPVRERLKKLPKDRYIMYGLGILGGRRS